MDLIPGSLGTSASLYMRVVQAMTSVAGLLFLFSGEGFREYPSFCLLATVLTLIIPWSLFWATVDCLYVFIQNPDHQPSTILTIIIIDMMLAFLSLAASCSTISSTKFLFPDDISCVQVLCFRYHISATAAFVIAKVGPVAYRLALPAGAQIHLVFHVSRLKKKVGDQIVPQHEPPLVGQEGEVLAQPIAVLNKRLIKRNNNAVTQILVQWANFPEEAATWEYYYHVTKQFPTFDPWGQGSFE
ncbi:PREDICTED: CASP-like protein 5C3 [Ipomoea nil]|uniref:CASP-like protein 5C3 n=1 Tax=Ipomoea nil TaxID=35883 RepID=UPI00090143BE|nr:PREDICTED: CASP-like protein 5C3 [Ipomoea nil]